MLYSTFQNFIYLEFIEYFLKFFLFQNKVRYTKKKFAIILNFKFCFTLMNELIKCMLTICTRLSPDYRACSIVNTLTTSGNAFSITFHIPLLEVGCKSMHILKQMIKSINNEIFVYILHINIHYYLPVVARPLWL